jgi:hypothetical protein
MDKVKTVNGHQIKILTRDEINDELIAKGDWGIEYFVPGRTFKPFCITINRIRYRFEKLEDVEAFCRKHKKAVLKDMTQSQIKAQIQDLVWGMTK